MDNIATDLKQILNHGSPAVVEKLIKATLPGLEYTTFKGYVTKLATATSVTPPPEDSGTSSTLSDSDVPAPVAKLSAFKKDIVPLLRIFQGETFVLTGPICNQGIVY